jgi:hypothetical protein
MQDTEPALRQAGRVLVIDPAGRVLLLEGFDPAQPDRQYWVTIGGGLEAGEIQRRQLSGSCGKKPGSSQPRTSWQARSGSAALPSASTELAIGRRAVLSPARRARAGQPRWPRRR